MERRNRRTERTRDWRIRRSMGSPDPPNDLEPAVLEEEGPVVAVMAPAPHLHALHAPLVRRLRDRGHPEVDDPVREELLLEGPVPAALGGFFRHEEARDPEVPEPLEERERLRPPVAELEDELDRVPGVDGEDLEAEAAVEVEDLPLEHGEEAPLGSLASRDLLHPRGHALEVLPTAAQVQDRQDVRHGRGPQAQGGDVLEEARRALLEGHVEAGDPLEGVVVEDRVREGGLHRPARAAQEDDVSAGDAPAEDLLVEATH